MASAGFFSTLGGGGGGGGVGGFGVFAASGDESGGVSMLMAVIEFAAPTPDDYLPQAATSRLARPPLVQDA